MKKYYKGFFILICIILFFVYFEINSLKLIEFIKKEEGRTLIMLLAAIIGFFAVIVSQMWIDHRQKEERKYNLRYEREAKALEKKEYIVTLLGEVQLKLSLLNGQCDKYREFITLYYTLSPESKNQKEKLREFINNEASDIFNSRVFALDKFTLVLKLLEMYFPSKEMHKEGFSHLIMLLNTNDKVVKLVSMTGSSKELNPLAKDIKTDIEDVLGHLSTISSNIIKFKNDLTH